MTPLDFIKEAGEHYNDPVGAIIEALGEPLLIHSASAEWEILSYYYDEKTKQMVIDIQKK